MRTLPKTDSIAASALASERPRRNAQWVCRIWRLLVAATTALHLVHGSKAQMLGSARSRGPTDGVIPMGIQVISSDPPDGTIVKRGQSITLTCSTNVNWFFCVWRSPHGNKQCAIQETTTQNVCSGDSRIILKGSKNKCQVELRHSTIEDHGEWTCLLTDADDLATDKASIAIEIGVPAKLQFDPVFQDNVLRLTEGDVAEIRCSATGAHPAPRLSWLEPTNAQVDLTAEPEIVTIGSAYTTDVFHTIKYKASLQDDNAAITCIATQLDRNGKDVLYENMTTVKLKVDKLILPVDNALTQKIGLISGVLIAIIFFILLIICIIFLVCKRRRRKRSRSPSSEATDETSPEPSKPIWTMQRDPRLTPCLQSKYRDQESNRSKTGGSRMQQQHSNQPFQRHHGPSPPDKIVPKPTADSAALMSHKLNMMPMPLKPSVSQATVSTQSTTSHCSWEDRSVGGEIEDNLDTCSLKVGPERQQQQQQQLHPHQQPLLLDPALRVQSGSLHETHFDSELDLPKTVLHPYYSHSHPIYQQPVSHTSRQPATLVRPSSSLADTPMASMPLARPMSALGGAPVASYDTVNTRPMCTRNEQLTISAKSVFECKNGCFANEHEVHMCAEHESRKIFSPDLRTSEPHDV